MCCLWCKNEHIFQFETKRRIIQRRETLPLINTYLNTLLLFLFSFILILLPLYHFISSSSLIFFYTFSFISFSLLSLLLFLFLLTLLFYLLVLLLLLLLLLFSYLKDSMAFLMMAIASCTCSSLMIRGGANRILSSWVGLANSPMSLKRKHNCHASYSGLLREVFG